MFVWAGNAHRVLVNEKGRVKNTNHVDIQPKLDADGYKYIEHNHVKYYVHELVIQNHGMPPEKNRLPKDGERVKFVDGDPLNCEVENLEYTKKAKKGTFPPEPVPPATEQLVWDLLKQGKTYEQVQEIVAQNRYGGRSVSASKIAAIKKERIESQDEDTLTDSERKSLQAVKKSVGETDDKEAKRQELARQQAEERKKKAKEKREKEAEEARKAEEEADEFQAVEGGGGWWEIHQDGKRIGGKSYREDEAKNITKKLQEGDEDLLGEMIKAEEEAD